MQVNYEILSSLNQGSNARLREAADASTTQTIKGSQHASAMWPKRARARPTIAQDGTRLARVVPEFVRPIILAFWPSAVELAFSRPQARQQS